MDLDPDDAVENKIVLIEEITVMMNAQITCKSIVRNWLFLFLFLVLNGTAVSLSAQDTRNVTEPVFPATCTVLHAPLRSTADGPSVGSFGHRGARKTVFWVDPADGLVLVFMTNKWDLKKDEQAGLNAAFFKTAIAKYGQGAKPAASQAATGAHDSRPQPNSATSS